MIQLPHEMVNIIFSYCQSATNVIMKDYLKQIDELRCFEFSTSSIFRILKKNKEYTYKTYNHDRFICAYYYTCTRCNEYLTVKEYLRPAVVYGSIICYDCIDNYPY